MADVEDEIERLYQLPLSEFTSARDALASRAGTRGAEIKKLLKPNIAAWAVNQLFWRRRKSFDRLVTAATRLRAAHAARISGTPTDVAPAEVAHRAALKVAIDETKDVLQSAGDGVSTATVNAITETLQTLPWSEGPGRLARPMKPAGFSALAGLVSGGGAAKRLAQVVPIESARRTPSTAEKDAQRKREAETRRRDVAQTERDLRAAHLRQRKADAALADARQAVERAGRDREAIEAKLEQVTLRIQRCRDDLNAELKKSKEAAAESARLEHRLASLKSES